MFHKLAQVGYSECGGKNKNVFFRMGLVNFLFLFNRQKMSAQRSWGFTPFITARDLSSSQKYCILVIAVLSELRRVRSGNARCLLFGCGEHARLWDFSRIMSLLSKDSGYDWAGKKTRSSS